MTKKSLFLAIDIQVGCACKELLIQDIALCPCKPERERERKRDTMKDIEVNELM
jgi:hypothetical protein